MNDNEFLANLKYGELHAHSRGSDGWNMPEVMANVAASLNNDAHAMTEHGTCGCLVHHWKACNSEQVLPIMGNEVYIRLPSGWQNGDYKSRNSNSGRYHMTVLATSYEGYERLIKLNNAAHANMEEVKGVKFPITTVEMVEEFAGKGLTVLTGCPSSITFHDSITHAEEYVNWLIDTFGKGQVYAEVMEHIISRDDDTDFNCWDRPMQLAERFNIPIVWTNDVHVAKQEQLEMLKSYTKAKKGYSFTAGWIRGKEEAFKICTDRIGEENAKKAFTSIDTIIRSVEPIELEREFVLPECDDVVEEMMVELEASFNRDVEKNGEVINGRNARESLDTEVTLLKKWDFLRFIAPQWDICNYANKLNILFNVRGSSSGSYVAYLLGISTLHPLKHELIWERFLCEKRLGKGDTPDIDIDIDTEKRKIVQDYARKRWGFEGVGTYLTYGHASTVRRLSKVYSGRTNLDMDNKLVNDAAHFEPYEDEELNIIEAPEFVEWYSKASWIKPMYDELIGSIDTHGRHACAMAPLLPEVPVPIEAWASEPVIAYSESSTLKTLQLLGLVKYDLLGLRTMSIIQALIDMTEVRCPDVIEDNDPCFSVFHNEIVSGLFQFDSRLGKELVHRAATETKGINNIRDAANLTALGRPGAMDYADTYFSEMVEEEHPPEIQEIFNETNGVLIYQEQVARLYAWMTHGELTSDSLQDGVVALKELVPKHWKQAESQEFKDKYHRMRTAFINGGKKRGYIEEYAHNLFESLKGYIRYGFNLSHALSYANLSAQMAWYKYNYPAQYWAVLLDSKSDSKYLDKTQQYVINALLESGITFVPPHINVATGSYTLSKDCKQVYAPLNMVKGLGLTTVLKVVAERNENGPFRSLEDFAERCPSVHAGQKRVMYEAGMFDGLGGDVHAAGIAKSKPYVLRGKLWNEENTSSYDRVILSIDKVFEHKGRTVLDVKGSYYVICEDDDKRLVNYKKELKVKKVSGTTDQLMEGMTILAHVSGNNVIDYRRVAYKTPYEKPQDIVMGIKKALGFAVPNGVEKLFLAVQERKDKAMGYVSKIEERRTPQTTQYSLTLQSGQRIWFLLEDRTKSGFLAKQSEYNCREKIPDFAEGDLIGATLLTTFKDDKEVTFGQITNFMVIA